MRALDLLTGDAQAFVDKVWATQVHVHHTSPADLTALLSLGDVDHLLTSSGLRTPALRLAKDGSVLPNSSFTRSASLAGVAMSGLVDARKVLDLFDDGATIVLQGLQRYWPAVTSLVRELEQELGHPAQANAYLTPRGSQGFALHSDTHDVFVVQTHGRKRWEIHDESGVQEVLLEPGTCVYLPTGTAHAARTEGEVSLHLTVGINQVTWRRVIEQALCTALPSDVDQHLPAGYLHDLDTFTEQVAQRLSVVSDALRQADPAAVAIDTAERFWTGRPTVVPGGLRDRLAVHSMGADTRLRRRVGSTCELRTDGEVLRVLLGDRELRVPGRLQAALELVRTRSELTVAELTPVLDPQSAHVLARRLVVEGLLEVAR